MFSGKVVHNVNVSSFVNPHLFWITFKDEQIEKQKTSLEKKLAEIYQYESPKNSTNFKKGDLVIVFHNNAWKRATIEEIEFRPPKKFYSCWLIDHGFLIETTAVFRHFKNFDDDPYAKQAAINNVVFVEQKMDLSSESIKTYTVKNVAVPFEILVKRFIFDNKTLFFVKEYERSDILFGDLMYSTKNGEIKSFRDTLAEENLVIIDENSFVKELDINYLKDKANFLSMLRHIALEKKRSAHSHYKSVPLSTPMGEDLKRIQMNAIEKEIEAQSFRLSRRIITKKSDDEEVCVKSENQIISHKNTNMESESRIQKVDNEKTPKDFFPTEMIVEISNKEPESPDPEIKTVIDEIKMKRRELLFKKKRIDNKETNKISENNTQNIVCPGIISPTPSESKKRVDPKSSLRDHIKSPTSSNSTNSNLDTNKETSETKKSIDLKPPLRDHIVSPSSAVSTDSNLDTSKETSDNILCSFKNNDSALTPRQKSLFDLIDKRKEKYRKYAAKEREPQDSESDWKNPSKNSTDLEEDSDNQKSSSDNQKASDSSGSSRQKQKLDELIKAKKVTLRPAGACYTLQNTEKFKKKYLSNSKHSELSEQRDCFFGKGEENHEIDKNVVSDATDVQDSEKEHPEGEQEKVSDSKLSEEDKENTTKLDEEDANNSTNQYPVNTLVVKPSCSCKSCNFYTTSECLNINDVSKRVTKILDLEGRPPRLLRRPENEIKATNLKYTNSHSVSKMEKLQIPKQIIHGTFIPRPLKMLPEAPMNVEIHKFMRSFNYETCKKLQMYTWPAVLNFMNLCIVNGPKSGKTFGYLPPLCSFVIERNERYKELSKHKGPIVVILCPNSKQCQEIYDLLKVIFVASKHMPKMITATYPLRDLNVTYVDILITLPTVLATLLKANVLNLKRVCHLVIEDLSTILEKHKVLLNQILDVCQSMLDHRHCELGMQVISTSTKWTISVENFLKRFDMLPLICIGDYLEAAVYGRVSINMKFLESNKKVFALLNILKDKYKIMKSLVVCNKDEIDEIVNCLNQQGIDLVMIPDEMPEAEVISLEERWNSLVGGQYSVLICTDRMLNSVLTITDARLLVHYSLPSTYTVFCRRFPALFELIRSPLAADREKQLSECYVLTDESCLVQIPRFLHFLQRMNQMLPDQFKAFLQKHEREEREKAVLKLVRFCEHYKLLGRCPLLPACQKRHFLNEDLDVIPNLPENGKLKFKIVKAEDVTHFLVNIVEYTDVNNVVYQWKDYIPEDVETELTRELNTTPAETIKLGKWYACRITKHFQETFCRCEVRGELAPDKYYVKLIDEGRSHKVNKEDIFELPERFQKMPLKLVRVYLGNFVPPFKDDYFSNRAYQKFVHILEASNYKHILLSGDIYLQLGNTFWLKDVVHEIVIEKQTLTKLNLTKVMRDLKLVEVDESQLENLYKLCAEADITLPKYVSSKPKAVKKVEEQVRPQWAFLDSEKCQEVTFSSAVSPDEFYVILNKYEDLRQSLQKEIQEIVKNPLYNRDVHPKVGRLCLAAYKDGYEYFRSVVLRVHDNKALCFYVDFGDEDVVNVTDLRHIPNHIITKLPFQSIRCRLYGIKPIMNDWQEEATDILYNYAFKPDSEVGRLLHVKCCDVQKMGLTRKKYAVLLKDGFSNKHTLINDLLVDCGLALTKPEETFVDFVIPKIQQLDDSDVDSDVEETLDILKTTEEVQHNISVAQVPDAPGIQELNLDEIELVVFDNVSFLRQLREQSEAKEPSADSRNYMPAIMAAEKNDYFTPDVIWSETEENVKVNIIVSGLGPDYMIKLTKGKLFNFRTTVNERPYVLKLVLFAPVESTYQHSSVGNEVRVTFKKVTYDSWPRLVSSTKRMRNIRYDLATINVDDEKKRKFLDLGDISEDSDVDDDVKYFEISSADEDESDYVHVDSDE